MKNDTLELLTIAVIAAAAVLCWYSLIRLNLV